MSTGMKAIKGSVVLTGGQALSQACVFVRNVILARILAKDDFGIAATFWITMSLLEIAGKLAIRSLVVQSKDGDRADFVSTAHFVQFLAAAAGSLLFLALADVLARLFGIPEARWAFQVLALAPLLRGLEHLDVSRFVRRMRFVPSVAADVAPEAVVTALSWFLAVWLKDYRAILWILILRQLLAVGATHFLAEYSYRWSWRGAFVRQIASFGWPLLINGFLMFGISQGDRWVVGNRYAMSQLGDYAIAGSLTLVPGLMLVRVISTLALPVMSGVQDSPAEMRKQYGLCLQALSLFATAYAAAMIVCGEPFVRFVYTDKYEGVGVLVGWLAAAQALRLIRAAPTIAAMARGDTRNLTLSNVVRLSGLALAFAAAYRGKSISFVAASALAGEALALVFSVARLSRRHGLPARDGLAPIALGAAALLAAGAMAFTGVPHRMWLVPVLAAGFLVGLLLAAWLAVFPGFRNGFLAAARSVRSRLESRRGLSAPAAAVAQPAVAAEANASTAAAVSGRRGSRLRVNKEAERASDPALPPSA